MSSPVVRVERRVGQRFPYVLPVSFRLHSSSVEGVGFTQDLSSKGVFLFTDSPLAEGSEIEITLRMPSEITLGESMPVRCQGRVLRITRPASYTSEPKNGTHAETKIGAAIRLETYEYLYEAGEYSRDFSRVSALHSHPDDKRPLSQSAGRTLQR